ncbi:hypothetical protein QO021_28875 (plasmid) [Pseudomonas amygdali pv. lachrymans]|uniref:hypothetical protein n=1 Tax=Pseudomonas amygdali TaxID=47877 RepID=UPI000A3E807F|nr:hypothetical protein [Pseudomonas amygdali]WIO61703.1 hypothetical protein QO021_28875 [Pseudomonas amygdali pv. lachrymans]
MGLDLCQSSSGVLNIFFVAQCNPPLLGGFWHGRFQMMMPGFVAQVISPSTAFLSTIGMNHFPRRNLTDTRMKLKTARMHPNLAPTLDAAQLYAQHNDLKHKLWRSAHTDHFTRTEREQMRETLAGLSEAYRSVTGASLK